MPKIIYVLATYGFTVALYLALAGSLDAVEIACALASSLPATFLGVLMAAVSRRDFSLRLPVRAVMRPLLSLLPDTAATGRAIAAAAFAPFDASAPAQRGGFTRQPFHPGGAEAATRRAAVLIGTSFAPRTFVVRGEASDEMLLHSLPGKPASPDRDWLL